MKKENIIKILKKILITAIIILIIGLASYLGYKEVAKMIKEQQQENLKSASWMKENIHLIENKDFGENIYSISAPEYVKTYNILFQEEVSNLINEMLKNNEYTKENPLIVYNPYKTNATGVNIYFNTDEKETVEYTVSVNDKDINDYSAKLSSGNTEHAYQIIGLVAGYKNTISLKIGETTTKIKVNLKNVKTQAETKLKVKTKSDEELSNGLFTIQGNDSKEQDFVALYDNDGVLRSEYPIENYRSHKLLFNDNKMYYSISRTKMVEVNNLGEVTKIYKLDGYELHHDYVFDDDNNILVLGTDMSQDSVEDIVLKINTETSEVSEVVDLGDILKSYKESCYFDKENGNTDGENGLDWIHINTIQYLNNELILSSRETSSIIKLSNINNNPTLKYIIGDKSFWEETDFIDYVFDKDGDFTSQGGQHTVTYEDDGDDNNKTYYLYMFNNNMGNSTTQPDFDWASIGLTNNNGMQGDTSKYYKYYVDEENKTYKLVKEFDVPYSGFVSSVQEQDNNNIVVDSGAKGVFSEYNQDGEIIRQYTMKLNKYFIYRVLKYDFNNFYFE